MFKKILIIIIILIIVAVGGLIFYYFLQINQSASAENQSAVFTVAKGEGVKNIAQNLKDKGLIKNKTFFGYYVFFDGSQAKFYAGDYLLNKNMNIIEVVDVLTSGKATNEAVITIIEGKTKKEIAEYLEKENIVFQKDFLEAADMTDSRQIIPNKNYTFLADKPAQADLEGFLFPDTYRIYKNSTSAQIIEKMLDNFDKKLTPEFREEIKKQNHAIFEIVTLASIVEGEIGYKTTTTEEKEKLYEDRQLAAGIFYKRLKLGMPLQSDATVNYVTGKGLLQPTSEDITVDNLYNTYKYKGLPPGPINNPSLSAIKAAIYPEESDYLYFLTKPDGSTVFSKTYQEHLENKARYLK